MINAHGWSRALDVQMDQHKWQLTDQGMGYTITFLGSFLEKAGEYPESKQYEFVRDVTALTKNLTITLWRADTIYLTKDMQHLILQAAHDLPAEATFDSHNLITPVGFCMFEETLYGEDAHGATLAINAIAWQINPISWKGDEPREALVIYFFTPLSDMSDDINRVVVPKMRAAGHHVPPLALTHLYPTAFGDTVPQSDHPGSELVTGLLKMFIAMQLIAQQKIGEPVRLLPDRPTRRRMAREGMPERLITLITLRRKSAKKDEDEDKEPIPWSRRWVVRGHWRRQWYPSLKRHDWKYIYEYVKGPENKPLVITERRVFNFRR
jgi:hypothetical protein